MSDDMDRPGRWVIEALGQEPDVWGDANAYFRNYDPNEEPRSARPALDALRVIGAYVAGEFGTAESDLAGIKYDEPIKVPWWVIAVLVQRWETYEEALSKGSKVALGKAFLIEGSGQGSRNSVSMAKNQRFNLGIALEVAALHEIGMKVRDAIEFIANKRARGFDTVQDIWKQNGKWAREVVEGQGDKLAKFNPWAQYISLD